MSVEVVSYDQNFKSKEGDVEKTTNYSGKYNLTLPDSGEEGDELWGDKPTANLLKAAGVIDSRRYAIYLHKQALSQGLTGEDLMKSVQDGMDQWNPSVKVAREKVDKRAETVEKIKAKGAELIGAGLMTEDQLQSLIDAAMGE